MQRPCFSIWGNMYRFQGLGPNIFKGHYSVYSGPLGSWLWPMRLEFCCCSSCYRSCHIRLIQPPSVFSLSPPFPLFPALALPFSPSNSPHTSLFPFAFVFRILFPLLASSLTPFPPSQGFLQSNISTAPIKSSHYQEFFHISGLRTLSFLLAF